jgi:hypothetical protein
MDLRCRRIRALPPLAWCARLEKGSPVVTLTHGPWVETNGDTFVEGAWDGPFPARAFERAGIMLGSGGHVGPSSVVFVSASHILERVHLIRVGDTVFVSNSLAFVLTSAGAALDPAYTDYQPDLWSIMHGFDRCRTQIPTRSGPPVRLFYNTNLEVDRDLRVQTRAKPEPPSWRTFAEYRDFLQGSFDAVAANAQAVERLVRYEPIATISTGYDSPASALIASRGGCRKAVTFRTAVRYFDDGGEVADSGAAIAGRIGLEVEEYATDAHLEGNGHAAPEFASCGDAYDLHLSALEDRLRGRLLVTGTAGDRVWNRLNTDKYQNLQRGDPSGTGMGEFRLRVGFVHVPVPFFGAMGLRDIVAISRSAEMAPWSIGDSYDRPIPRRLLEEAGVPRDWFGRIKQGAFATVCGRPDSPSRFPSFEAFYQTHRPGRLVRARAGMRSRALEARRLWTRAADRYRFPGLIGRVTQWDIAVPGRHSLVVQWGCATVQERYRQALSADR